MKFEQVSVPQDDEGQDKKGMMEHIGDSKFAKGVVAAGGITAAAGAMAEAPKTPEELISGENQNEIRIESEQQEQEEQAADFLKRVTESHGGNIPEFTPDNKSTWRLQVASEVAKIAEKLGSTKTEALRKLYSVKDLDSGAMVSFTSDGAINEKYAQRFLDSCRNADKEGLAKKIEIYEDALEDVREFKSAIEDAGVITFVTLTTEVPEQIMKIKELVSKGYFEPKEVVHNRRVISQVESGKWGDDQVLERTKAKISTWESYLETQGFEK